MSIKVFGHTWAQDFFQLGLRRERLPHAFLIAGPGGVGKRTFATWCIQQILDLSPTYQRQRQQYGSVAMEALPFVAQLKDPTLESARRISRFLRRTLPSSEDWRAVLIEAEEMPYATQAALLKSFEEPPPKTLFFLLIGSEGRITWPLRSRCQTVHLRPLSRENFCKVWSAFSVHHKIVPGDAHAWFDLSGGCLGRAYKAALQEQDEDLLCYRTLLSKGLLCATHPNFVSPFTMDTQDFWTRLRPAWLYEHFYIFVSNLLIRVYSQEDATSEAEQAIVGRLSIEAWASFLEKARTLCHEAEVFNLAAMHVAPFLFSLGFAQPKILT